MLQAVDENMRILARVAMIKGECLEAREADDICVSDRLGRQAFTVEQLGGQFGLVVQIKHHRGMGDVERRDVAFGRKHLDLPAAELRMLGEELEDHGDARLQTGLPRSEEHTSELQSLMRTP